LRRRFPDLLEVLDRNALYPIVLRIHRDGDRIEGDRNLHVLNAFGTTGFHFLGEDRPRCARDIRIAAAELLESTAGP